MSVREKVAFVHYQKAVGSFINFYLTRYVFDSDHAQIGRHGWKRFNSWRPPFELARDWTEQELMDLANNRSVHQQISQSDLDLHNARWRHDYLDKQYVHNHHMSWSRGTVREFKANGWFTFTFLREPAEVLCSTYFWARDLVARGMDPMQVFQPVDMIDLTLDRFIREIISGPDPVLRQLYGLPGYVNDLDFVAEYSEQNFAYFLQRYFHHPLKYHGNRRNVSSNRGYTHYCASGDISERTQVLLDSDPMVLEVRALLGPV